MIIKDPNTTPKEVLTFKFTATQVTDNIVSDLKQEFARINKDNAAPLIQYAVEHCLDERYIAYIIATAYHETAFTMTPVEEYGKGAGRPYGTWLSDGTERVCACGPNTKDKYRMSEYPNLYYGRGYVQLTWFENYQRVDNKFRQMGLILDSNAAYLTENPALACDPKIAAIICVEGMLNGWFTGKKLSDYFSDTVNDALNARRIVNGTDKAEAIKVYYDKILNIVKKHYSKLNVF